MHLDAPTIQIKQEIFRKRWMELKGKLERAKRDDDGHFYVPLGEVERILSESTLTSLFKSWEPQPSRDDIQKAAHLILERRPEEDLAAYRFLRCFATLIYCENEDYIKEATRYFLNPTSHELPGSKVWKPPEDDAYLLIRSTGKEAFYNKMGLRHDGFYKIFFNHKKHFCAFVLKEGGRHEVDEDIVLPFFIKEENVLGEGGAGRVFKVRVGKRHWVNKWLSNPEDMPLVVKRFKHLTTNGPTDRFDNEFKNLMKLKNARIKSENVMLPLASLVQGKQRYLIYDLAEMDLSNYMWKLSPTYSFNVDSAKGVLKNGTDLVGALKWIHQYKPYHSIWHGDIRPENILILKDSSREIWKLADFDRSRDKINLSESDGSLNPNDQQSYRSPERKRGKRGDVWSMACMITLILSWLADGPKGIGEFLTKRNKGIASNPDTFYNWEEPGSSNVLSPMVGEWLEILREKAEKMASDYNTDDNELGNLKWYCDYVGNVIDHLSNRLFVKDRVNANVFYDFMEKAYSEIPNTDYTEPESIKESEKLSPASATSIDASWSEVHTPTNVPSPGPTTPTRNTFLRPPTSPEKIIFPTITVATMPPTSTNFHSKSRTQTCSRLCSAIGEKPAPESDLALRTSEINEACPNCGIVPIHEAIRKRSQTWLVKLLSTEGIDLEKKSQNGGSFTPLMRSCREDQMWAAERLLAAGCQLNVDYDSIPTHRIRKEIKKYVKEEEKRRRR
ncbi:hypothetical protein N0V90_003556 [Kalmusia sp. IMI 367209]|nr:hypothetical protein N0V90_003556 [Kalmusia sp. IMI 367209]